MAFKGVLKKLKEDEKLFISQENCELNFTNLVLKKN